MQQVAGKQFRNASANEYVQLKRLVKQRGLLIQQPAYYTWKFLFTLGLLATSIALFPAPAGIDGP